MFEKGLKLIPGLVMEAFNHLLIYDTFDLAKVSLIAVKELYYAS